MMTDLPTALRAELVRYAEQAAPLEAVGLLSGPRDPSGGSMHPTRLWRAQNASQEPETSFLIDPREQTALLRAIWAEGEELAGIFHSHPRSDPKPSERDRAIAAAQPRPLAWVIVGFPPCPEGCDGSEDRRCRTCGDWGYVPDLWVGQLPS